VLLTGRPPAVPPPAGGLAILAERLAHRLSPAWVASLLAPLTTSGVPLPIDPIKARQALMVARLTLGAQAEAMRLMEAAGLEPVALKGYAHAHALYDEPAARMSGDLDVLVRRAHLAAVIDLFGKRNYAFAADGRRRWGFVSDASFVPFFSPDGLCNIDLHVEADSWPLHVGLPADDVRRAARRIPYAHGTFAAPSPEHALLIAISNIAKDRFFAPTLSKAIDLSRLLARHAGHLDWSEIETRGRRAALMPTLHVTFALLVALGLPQALVPEALTQRPTGLSGQAFTRLLVDWLAMFPRDPGAASLLAREALLAREPATFVALNLRRLRGLMRRGDGIPPEARLSPS
jgi:hypothetical protein